MIKSISFFLSVLFLLTFASCGDDPVSGKKTGSIEGTIIDGVTELALSKAQVTTTPPTFSVTTDTTGSYQIANVEPGTYRVTASKFGYDSAGVNISVSEGKITTADISLLSDTLSTP